MKEPLVIKASIRIAVQFWYPNKSVLLRYVLSTIGVGIKVPQPKVPSIVLIKKLLAAWIFGHFFHRTGTLIQNSRATQIKATKKLFPMEPFPS